MTGDGPLLPEHVVKLTYTRQVMDEAMRLYPPAPLIARSVDEDVEIAGEILPKGSVVFVPIYAVHRHESLWTRARQVRPRPFRARGHEGSSSLRVHGRLERARASASATPSQRWESVAILAVLAKALRLDLVDPRLPKPQMHITLRPRRPLRMRVTPTLANRRLRLKPPA